MSESVVAIIVHQLIFQGMFFTKNVYLKKKSGLSIRGTNNEANIATVFIMLFICVSLYLSVTGNVLLSFSMVSSRWAHFIGYAIMGASIGVAVASLCGLGDSWRVGVIEEQQTNLVQCGIYRFTRNPYFVSYIMIFFAYTIFLQNLLLLLLTFVGCRLIDSMVRKEEAYLETLHGEEYSQYKQDVPRYLPRFFK
jgi:protein-S-isoprenylcysteine O-methyltransferase Ste14